jgi:exopolysaccharide production protein ExoQ
VLRIIALTFCTALVLALLRIEHRRNPEASLVLWVPTLWMAISASRPLSSWFGGAAGGNIEAGSPLDRYVLSAMIACSIIILRRRRFDWSTLFRGNLWFILLLVYSGVSIYWSEIPFASFKRWIRIGGEVLLAFVVLSESMPLRAMESVLRRCAYILIPFSIVLIKYFPTMGVEYGVWSGERAWTGVGIQKNTLGQLCALSGFFLVWALIRDLRSSSLFKEKSQTMADVLVLCMTIFLLKGPSEYAFSATSVSVLMIGVATFLFLYRLKHIAGSLPTLVVVGLMYLCSAYFLLFDQLIAIVAPIFGRDVTFTGRSEIWRAVLNFAYRNPVLGVGYGGFWAPDDPELARWFDQRFILSIIHNGYLAVFVELGSVGATLLGCFLLAFGAKAAKRLNNSYEWGGYGICVLVMSLVYNLTEVAFLRSACYMWSTMVFLTVVLSGGYLAGERGSP